MYDSVSVTPYLAYLSPISTNHQPSTPNGLNSANWGERSIKMKNKITEMVTSKTFDFPKIAEAIKNETESPIEIGINGVHMYLDA